MVDGKRSDMVLHQEDPLNAEPTRAAVVDAPITPLDAFYVRSHGPVPEIDESTWRLGVDGLVDRQLSLSLDELRELFPEREIVATLQCAGNRRLGFLGVRDIPGEAPWGPGATATAEWRGVRLGDVLAHAGLLDEAGHLEFTGADISSEADPPQAFGASIPRHKAEAAEVLLAWEMNGRPLPPLHGAPLRVIVPGYVGARSVKWLERISALRHPSGNFFQAQTYRLLPADAGPSQGAPGEGVPLGAVAVNSDILSPEDGAHVPAGRVRVAGYAFAGDDRRIVRVDVSTDGGASWRQADLAGEQGPWAWRLWETEVELSVGPCAIVARAWDSAAATQPEDPAHLWNPKGYVNNAWARAGVTAR